MKLLCFCLLILPSILGAPASIEQCDENKGFKCIREVNGGQFVSNCLPKEWVCDGEPDCQDGSDEESCVNGEKVEGGQKCAEPNAEQIFDYEGQVITTASDWSGNRMKSAYSAFKISGKVLIATNPEAEDSFIMKLRQVQAEEYIVGTTMNVDPDNLPYEPSSVSQEFAAHLERYHIKFSYAHGHVSALYSSEHEPEWVLNIKRGIVSTIQVHFVEPSETQGFPHYQYGVPEVDVSGNCVVNYTIINNPKLIDTNEPMVIVKTKNPKMCSRFTRPECSLYEVCQNNEGPNVEYSQTNITLSSSRFDCKSNPIIDSSKTVEYFVNQDPVGDFRLITFIKQMLKRVSNSYEGFQNQLAEESANESWTRKPLEYQPFEETFGSNQEGQDNEAQQEMTKLVQAYVEELKAIKSVSAEAPRLFMEMLSLIRKTDDITLNKMYKKYKETSEFRKVFLEVLSSAESPQVVELMTQQIMLEQVTAEESRSFLKNIALITAPTAEMLTNVMAIAQKRTEIKEQVILSLGSMVYNYMKYHRMNEIHAPWAAQEAKNYLGTEMKRALARNDERDILVCIKALINSGQSSFLPMMLDCARNCPTTETRTTSIYFLWKVNPNDIDAKVINELAELYANRSNPIEVRIASFVMLIEARPSIDTINLITHTLRTDGDVQVSNFVCTYLTSADDVYFRFPYFFEKKHFERSKIVDAAVRRMTRNCEAYQYWFNTSVGINYGSPDAMVDSHIIYTPESPFPRQMMFNVELSPPLVEMLGYNSNLFEIGVRAEGIEHLIKILKEAPPSSGSEAQKIFSDFLGERMQQSTLQHQSTGKNQEANQGCHSKIVKPKLTSYLTIFGHELQFNYMDTNSLIAFLSNMKKETHYQQAFSMGSFKYDAPTSMGIPLKMRVMSGGMTSLNFSLDINLKNASVNLNVEPSGSLHVFNKVMLDAYYLKSGFQVNVSGSMSGLAMNAGISYVDGHFEGKANISNGPILKTSDGITGKMILSRKSSVNPISVKGLFSAWSSNETKNCVDSLFSGNWCETYKEKTSVDSYFKEGEINYEKSSPNDKYSQFSVAIRKAGNGIVLIEDTKSYFVERQPDGTVTAWTEEEGEKSIPQSVDQKLYPSALSLPPLNQSCVSVNISEWTPCRTTISPCTKGFQHRLHVLACDHQETEQCKTHLESRECQSCACVGVYEQLREENDNTQCASVRKHLQCKEPCSARATKYTKVAFECKNREGIDSESYTKLIPIPTECVCNLDTCPAM